MTVKQLLNLEELEKKDTLYTVAHFYTDGLEECSHMNSILERLSNLSEYENVVFVKCLVENSQKITQKYQVTAVPTFLYFKNGNCVDKLTGADAIILNKKLKELVAASSAESKDTNSLTARLESLINSAPIMLFMKGSSENPQCKFSREIVSILQSLNVKYETFNILTDEEVRSGLKEYSNWPTYPQVYVNGELIGGLDIVKEMIASGELQQLVKSAEINLSLENKLHSLVNKADVMVFIKGEKDAPFCGFSRQILEILKPTGIPFETFNILTDNEVREGLKSYSNWPTYPQVYVKGNFIGGLDIIKELKDTNELIPTIKGEE